MTPALLAGGRHLIIWRDRKGMKNRFPDAAVTAGLKHRLPSFAETLMGPRKSRQKSRRYNLRGRIETEAEISGTAMVKGLAAIQAALEAEGIEFTDDKGVLSARLHPKKRRGK